MDPAVTATNAVNPWLATTNVLSPRFTRFQFSLDF